MNDIKWETTTQTNLGLDFSLFNQTLYGSFDWFYKKTTDILVQMAGIAAMGEGSSQWINAGEMNNKGFELNLGYRNTTAFGLKYDLSGNISAYRNEITALPATVAANGTFGGNGVESVIGHPNGAQVGYVLMVSLSHRKKLIIMQPRKVPDLAAFVGVTLMEMV